MAHTSKYKLSNAVIFSGNSKSTGSHIYSITNTVTGDTKTSEFIGKFTLSFQFSDSFFCNDCDYNFTVYSKNYTLDDKVVVNFTELLPANILVLSDNEDYSVESFSYEFLYFSYHLPAKEINNVTAVHFYVTDGSSSGWDTGYIGNKQFPDPEDPLTYFWKLAEKDKPFRIDIDKSDPHFCSDMCTYYITVKPGISGIFSILPNITFDYITIPTTQMEERADISPKASSYGKIYVPKQSEDEKYYNLEITFYFIKPIELVDIISTVALFVTLDPIISPSSVMWYAQTDIETLHGSIVITNNDPFFCSDCYYYVRLDGVPDVYYTIDTKIFASTNTYWSPIRLLPEERYRGAVRATNSVEQHYYEFYVPADTTESYIDTIVLTMDFDSFVEEELFVVFTNQHDEYKHNCQTLLDWLLQFVGTKAVFYLGRKDLGFCTNNYFVVKVSTNDYKSRPINFHIQAYYNRGLIVLKDNIPARGDIIKNTEGVNYLYNATHTDMDTDYYITLKNNCTKQIYVHIDSTSFNDGDRGYTWELIASSGYTNALTIRTTDTKYVFRQPYYLRVDMVDDWADVNCNYEVSMKSNIPEVTYLTELTGEVTVMFNIPREKYYYYAIQTLYIRNLQEIHVIFNVSSYAKISGIYIKSVSYPKPALKIYDFISYNYQPVQYFSIRRGDPGFVENATYYILLHVPVHFLGNYFTIRGYPISNPVELKFDDPYSDIIEQRSGSDFFYFQLTQSASRPRIVITLKKKFTPNKDIFISVTTGDEKPDKEVHHWFNYTEGTKSEVQLYIGYDSHYYCTGCTYQVAIGPIEITEGETQYTITVGCPDGGCQSCPPHFTPESNCKKCEAGYYGSSCSNQCNCGHGTCKDGVDGDGSCTCYDGWQLPYCNQCLSSYFGLNCEKCFVDCNGKGSCNDGSKGDGTCKCDYSYLSSESHCTDCIYGLYDHDCSDVCPGGVANICSSHGKCNSGMKGNGFCRCDEGYAGFDCNTPSSLSTCKPPCDINHGACDERVAECKCYDNYSGSRCQIPPATTTPSPKPSKNGVNGAVVAVIIVVVLVLIGIVGALIFFLRRRTLFTLFSKKPSKSLNTPITKYQVLE